MVWELFKASDKQQNPVCIIDWGPEGPMVVCDGVKDYVKRVFDKDKVCVVEFDPKQNKAFSYCGSGKEIAFRILK